MFTGIENTGHIKLSKEDTLASTTLSEEDNLLLPLADMTVSEWAIGKPFLAASERVRLVFSSAPDDPYGHVLYYTGFSITRTPTGAEAISISFRDSLNRQYIYQRESRDSLNLKSSDLPMLIDLDLVAQADSLLTGRTVWTRTLFWDNAEDFSKTVSGTQLMPVTIERIVAADPNFPLRAIFSDGNGRKGSLIFSPLPTSSRSFATQFYISDPRIRYKKVTDEKWLDICLGRLSTGMTKQEARLTYGNPDNVESGHDYSKLIEIWHYSNGAYLRFEDGLLVSFRK